MGARPLRAWLDAMRRRPLPARRRPARAVLAVERCEDRALPSSSIPLNGATWTSIGPSPIANGQSPGGPASTGRLNGVAVDPTDPNVVYVATDSGGVWRTADGGHTW